MSGACACDARVANTMLETRSFLSKSNLGKSRAGCSSQWGCNAFSLRGIWPSKVKVSRSLPRSNTSNVVGLHQKHDGLSVCPETQTSKTTITAAAVWFRYFGQSVPGELRG